MNQAQTIALYQPVLQSIAMKMLGSMQDAEDNVQDTFLKWLSIDDEQIRNTKAYLVKSVTNNCINHINALKRKKDEYLENLNPSDLLAKYKDWDFAKFDFENEVSEALGILSKKLEPLEKAIFLFREVFDFEYDEIQLVLDKKKENCRKIFSRAKEKLNNQTKNITKVDTEDPSFIEKFKDACATGLSFDFMNQLADDVANKFYKK